MEKKANACCFAGHSQLPADKIEHILRRLNEEVEWLIRKGVNTFVSGGALGFDQMAAVLIAAKKELGYNIRLVLALPCHKQERFWPDESKGIYRYLVESADTVCYVLDNYTDNYMEKRCQYMVEQSTYCVCAFLRNEGELDQTVRYARKRGLTIVNVAD